MKSRLFTEPEKRSTFEDGTVWKIWAEKSRRWEYDTWDAGAPNFYPFSRQNVELSCVCQKSCSVMQTTSHSGILCQQRQQQTYQVRKAIFQLSCQLWWWHSHLVILLKGFDEKSKTTVGQEVSQHCVKVICGWMARLMGKAGPKG